MTGRFRLHAMRAGTLRVPRSFAFLGDSRGGLVELGFYVWVVTDGTTLGLIDSGLPLDADERESLCAQDPFDEIRLLPDLLADAGLAGSDIDFVAITQTVTYHTGGLDAGLLPRAHVYVSQAGVREMLNDPPGHPPTDQYFTTLGWAALRQLAVEGRLHCTDGPTEVVPGVVFETTGGHHPGSAALKFATGTGVTGLLETAFVQENLDRRHPIGICENVSTCRAAMRRYLHECDSVIPIHEARNAVLYPPDGLRSPAVSRPDTEDVR